MNKDEFTNRVFHLDVNENHSLYVHDWGNRNAKTPIINLHGGPGSQSKDKFKALFNPKKHRVIFFDQRGAGQSLPHGSIADNTTQDLINDISVISGELKINKSVLVGGSWGSCLALAYALHNPDKVAGIIISGIFTGSQVEIDWIGKGMFKTFYPDVWQTYLQATPAQHRHNPTKYHFEKILNGTKNEQKKSAYTYSNLEAAILQLDDRYQPMHYDEFDPSFVVIAAHYLSKTCFMPDRFILNNAHKLTMPVHIVQGRYDMVCPPETAFELHEKLPNSTLLTTTSGHRPEHEDAQLMRQAISQLTD